MLRTSSQIALLSLLMLGAVAHPVAARGQAPAKRYTLVVGVGDVESGAPLEGADVRVLDVGRSATTNSLGDAVITRIPAGTHHVQVRMIGYQSLESLVVFPQGASDSVQAIFMPRRGKVLLDTVVVAEKRVPRYLAAFERRRLEKQGQYLTESELAKADHWGFTDLLRQQVQSVRISRGADGFSRRLIVRDGTNLCAGAVFLDDVRAWDGDISGIHPEELAAVEVYDRVHVPLKYQLPNIGCGVMLLWTKQRP